MAFCNGCRSRIRHLMSKVDQFLLSNVDVALSITTKLRSFLGSDVAVILISIIPGDLDEKIRQLALKGLDVAITELSIINLVASPNLTTDQKLAIVLQHLRGLSKVEALNKLAKIASLITKQLDGRYDTHLYDLAVQATYSMNKLS